MQPLQVRHASDARRCTFAGFRCLVDEVALLKGTLADCRQQLKSSEQGGQRLVDDLRAARMLADEHRAQQQRAAGALQVAAFLALQAPLHSAGRAACLERTSQ